MALDQTQANAILTWMHGGSAPSALTTPMKLALMSTNGSATSAGTEVTGGSYARQTITFSAAAGGSQASNAACTYTSMPATTTVGVELYDSNGTPKRIEWGALSSSKTTASGDTLTIASGSYTSALA